MSVIIFSLFIFFSLALSFWRGCFFNIFFKNIGFLFFVFYLFLSLGWLQNNLFSETPNIVSVATTLPQEKNRKRQTLRLRYAYQHGNYLVFYDKNNTAVYLQYRWDRFDHTSDHIVKRIRRGISYFADLSLVEILTEAPLPLTQALRPKETSVPISQTSFRTREFKNVFVGILYRLDYALPQQTRF